MPKRQPSLVYMVFIRFLSKSIKRLVFNFVALTVFAHGSLSKAQDMPSAYELRSLMLMGAYGAYYCDVFKGKNPNFANLKAIFGISDQEASDPVLDSLGQYLGSRMKSYSPSCTLREYGNRRDAMLQDILEEWARQNPQGRSHFPYSYNFFGI